MRPIEPHIFYRRVEGGSVYVRDLDGRQNVYTFKTNGEAKPVGGKNQTLGPVYNRVDFENEVRFTGRVRSQSAMLREFAQVPKTQRLSTGWMALPLNASKTRRTANQGMHATMIALTGITRSATEYAIWYDGGAGLVNTTVNWEWCHLSAHSLGGLDGPDNVVAAVRGNNSEQLAIENALHHYRREDIFLYKVTAALVDEDDGEHMGDIIRYKVNCNEGDGVDLEIFLDCLNAPNPSAIHYYDVYRKVCLWANNKLARRNNVTGAEKKAIKEYVRSKVYRPY